VQRKSAGDVTIISTVGEEKCQAFIPAPLPPQPELKIDADLQTQLGRAMAALGRLDAISTILPNSSLFLYMYIRKEAVLSSQIEGTQSSLSDLLKHESKAAPGVPMDDVQEVSNYVVAMEYGLRRIKNGFPLSLRLFKEIHKILLGHGRGAEKNPGEFRRSQNWIGGTRPGNAIYVPPPPDNVMECMGQLENFLHDDPIRTPLLIKAALAHVQFESIHPFLDGNGRLGRLLITLLFCSEGILSEPTLYLSLYLKTHRSEYYRLLQQVRTNGDWESWLAFFLTGVEETAGQAVSTAKRLVELFNDDQTRVESLGRAAGSALRIHRIMQQRPIVNIKQAAEETSVSIPTATTALGHLERLGVVHQVPSEGRAKLYGYAKYIRILSEGTEPL